MTMTKCVPSMQVKCVKIPVKSFSFGVTLRLIFFSDIFFRFLLNKCFTVVRTRPTKYDRQNLKIFLGSLSSFWRQNKKIS